MLEELIYGSLLERATLLAYLLAGLLFIAALASLSRHETAERGNRLGVMGMGLALLATISLAASNASEENRVLTLSLIIGAMAVGGIIGMVMAKRVEMTGMPPAHCYAALFCGSGRCAGWF